MNLNCLRTDRALVWAMAFLACLWPSAMLHAALTVTPDSAVTTINTTTNFSSSAGGTSWAIETSVSGGYLTNPTGSATGYRAGSRPGFDFISATKGGESRIVPISVEAEPLRGGRHRREAVFVYAEGID